MDRCQHFGTQVFVTELKNLRTEIDGAVKDAIDAMSTARGMTIRAITEKTFGWLCSQQSDVQAVILGQIPSDAEFIDLVLKRLRSRDDVAGKNSPPYRPQDRVAAKTDPHAPAIAGTIGKSATSAGKRLGTAAKEKRKSTGTREGEV